MDFNSKVKKILEQCIRHLPAIKEKTGRGRSSYGGPYRYRDASVKKRPFSTAWDPSQSDEQQEMSVVTTAKHLVDKYVSLTYTNPDAATRHVEGVADGWEPFFKTLIIDQLNKDLVTDEENIEYIKQVLAIIQRPGEEPATASSD